jgi:large subunit ribosomal protein L3
MNFIIGKKLGMTQVYDEKGEALPVTLVEAGPCVVTDLKKKERDGYDAIQLGFLPISENKVKKSQNKKPYRHLKELKGSYEVSLGDSMSVELFTPGDKVKVRGVSKGKGFAGVMKRWNFSGAGTSSHGTKHSNRKPGSIGSMFPQRVVKGRKMAGRMGTDSVTVKNVKVVSIDKEKNIIALKGAVPGKNRGILTIEKI